MAGLTHQERRRRLAAELAGRIAPRIPEQRVYRLHVQLTPAVLAQLEQCVEHLQRFAFDGCVVTRSHVTRYALELLHRDLLGGEERVDPEPPRPAPHDGTGPRPAVA